MDRAFWNGKKVLVTGHTGFKGGWLSLWLLEMGAEVSGLSLAPDVDRCFFSVCNVDKQLHSDFVDIVDQERVRQVVSERRPDIIFHLAAQALVRKSYLDPVGTFSTNVMGVVNVLEAARHVDSVRVVVNVTTDKVYENQEWCWGYRENDRLGGLDPYSSSKACSEIVTQAYRSSFYSDRPSRQFPCALSTARAGNVIGGGDWSEDRLVPDILAAAIEGRAVKIRYPDAVRPWQHVLEPLSGYLKLAEKMWSSPQAFTGSWNFGPDQAGVKTVAWVVRYINAVVNGELELELTSQPHEAGLLSLDCSKARSVLDWKPKLSVEQALDSVIDWHRSFDAGNNMIEFTLNEIKEYSRLDGAYEKK